MTNFKRGKHNKPTGHPWKPTEREVQAEPRKIRKLGAKPCKVTKGEHEWDGKKRYKTYGFPGAKPFCWFKQCACGKKLDTLFICLKCGSEDGFSNKNLNKCSDCGAKRWGNERDDDITLFLRESNAIENVWDDESLEQAKAAWEYLSTKAFLTVHDINWAHGILMSGKLEPKYVGAFRDCPVWIGGREAPHWAKAHELAEKWVEKYAAAEPTEPPKTWEDVKESHKKLMYAHPWIDGNGRTGRLTYLWHLVKLGLPVKPILAATKRDNYYPWFTETDYGQEDSTPVHRSGD